MKIRKMTYKFMKLSKENEKIESAANPQYGDTITSTDENVYSYAVP